MIECAAPDNTGTPKRAFKERRSIVNLLGMSEFAKHKFKVERENFQFNFPQKETKNEER